MNLDGSPIPSPACFVPDLKEGYDALRSGERTVSGTRLARFGWAFCALQQFEHRFQTFPFQRYTDLEPGLESASQHEAVFFHRLTGVIWSHPQSGSQGVFICVQKMID